MRIKRRNPLENIEFVQQEMERLFTDMWGRRTSGLLCPHDAWRPPTDAFETPEGLIIRMELAGMREQEIEIMLEERTLVVSGHRPSEHHPECISYHQMGVNYGPFCVQIFLPWPVDEDAVTATYEDGFLEILLPKRPRKEEKARRVDIKVQESE
jgi:HSP20 family molecular chaperone IbpA